MCTQARRRSLRALALAGAAAVVLAAPTTVLAQADGVPNLDPTGGTTGTLYEFVAKGTTKSLTPAKQNEPLGTATGYITIFQDAGSGDLDADLSIDTQDGAHADLTCIGVVGRGRFALQCAGFDDDGDPIHLMMEGKALPAQAGGGLLRKVSGMGFSDERTVAFVLQANPMLP
jgi:hypothetical protein